VLVEARPLDHPRVRVPGHQPAAPDLPGDEEERRTGDDLEGTCTTTFTLGRATIATKAIAVRPACEPQACAAAVQVERTDIEAQASSQAAGHRCGHTLPGGVSESCVGVRFC